MTGILWIQHLQVFLFLSSLSSHTLAAARIEIRRQGLFVFFVVCLWGFFFFLDFQNVFNVSKGHRSFCCNSQLDKNFNFLLLKF